MTYLSHKASFHSRENITPSKHGTKHLDTETDVTVNALATTGVSDNITIASEPRLASLSQFKARQAGATLDIGNGVTVSQVTGNLSQAGALIFEGGNFEAVSSFFKELTGYTGDLDAIELKSSNIPSNATIYKVNTSVGSITLRNIAKSPVDCTIDLSNKLDNGIRGIKFKF